MPPALKRIWTVSTPAFTDTGGAGTSGTPPADGTRWQVKNLLELKNARRVSIDSNLIENNWQAAQPGYAVLFTPRNQSGGCPWCAVESVIFTHNVVRNVAAAVNILGHDTPNPSQQTNTIRLQDNLVYDVTTRMGGNGWGVLVGDGPRDIVVDHNTFVFDGTTLLYAYGAPSTTGFQFTNNAAPHGEYGINGAAASTGTLTLQTFFPGAVVTGNWLSGGPSARYPAGNRFNTPFDAGLTPPSTLGPLGADGRPAGADVTNLLPLIDTIPGGLMTAAPLSPRNLRISSSGR